MDLKLSSDEQIVWQGRPEFKPYFKSGIVGFLESFIFFVFVWSVFITLNKFQKGELNWTLMYLIALSILGEAAYRVLKKIIAFKKTAYFITNRRVIIRRGYSEERITSFEKSKIVFMDLVANKTERRFNAGTILFHLGEMRELDGKKEKIFYKLESVKDPNSILLLF